MIVDAHLDLAHNVVDLGRDLTLPLAELRKRDTHADVPVVTLPALREGHVGVCFATLWVDPRKYTDPESAHQQALRQLEVYLRWEEQGWVRILRDQASLQRHLALWPEDKVTALVILIEGAECIREPGEVGFWKVAMRPGRPFAFGPLRRPADPGAGAARSSRSCHDCIGHGRDS